MAENQQNSFEAIVSADTGTVLTAIKIEADDDETGESETESQTTTIALSQIIATAEQAASGTVISIDLDDDDMEDDDDKVSSTTQNADDDNDEHNQTMQYSVGLVDGDYIHQVLIDATTGEVSKVNLDPQQVYSQAITAATKWASLTTITTNATTAQSGEVQAVELELKEERMVYIVVVDSANQSYIITLDAALGTVISTESL